MGSVASRLASYAVIDQFSARALEQFVDFYAREGLGDPNFFPVHGLTLSRPIPSKSWTLHAAIVMLSERMIAAIRPLTGEA